MSNSILDERGDVVLYNAADDTRWIFRDDVCHGLEMRGSALFKEGQSFPLRRNQNRGSQLGGPLVELGGCLFPPRHPLRADREGCPQAAGAVRVLPRGEAVTPLQLIHNPAAGPLPGALRLRYDGNTVKPAASGVFWCGRCGGDVNDHVWILRDPDDREQGGVIDCSPIN